MYNSDFALAEDATAVKDRRRDKCVIRSLTVLSCLLVVAVIVLGVLYGVEVSKEVEIVTAAPPPTTAPEPEYCMTTECILTAAQLLGNMNASADPCEDFYSYACGGWLDKYDIPSAYSSYSAFTQMNDENMQTIKQILESQSYNKDSAAEQKTYDFYVSCMDTDQMDELGAQPFLDLVDRLGGWEILGNWDHENWEFKTAVGELDHVYRVRPFYSWDIGPDDMNPNISLYRIDQISRSTYLHNGENSTYVKGYKSYMYDMVTELGVDQQNASMFVEEVFEFERKLNDLALRSSQRVDPVERYNSMTFEELTSMTSSFHILENLNSYYEQTIENSHPLVSYGPEYLEPANVLVNGTEDRILHNFMMWKLLDSVAYHLSKPFRDHYTDFNNLLTGKTGQSDRWKDCQNSCNGIFDMAVGAMFVREAFSEESKGDLTKMVDSIKAIFVDRLPEIEWMDDPSRETAEVKADYMTYDIGYPDYIRDPVQLDKRWEGYEVDTATFFNNTVTFNRYYNQRIMGRIFKPADPNEWYLPPQIVNAFYDPSANKMTYLAGILQSPMYDPVYSMSVNYGGIGMVMGHELTHGFDTIGGTYNQLGALVPGGWYSNSSAQGFSEATQCVVDLYNGYCLPQVGCVDGDLTKSENIADLGGIQQSFNAYKDYYVKIVGEEAPLPGFNSHEETFFLGFAQGWCTKYTKEYLEIMLQTDPHSPAMYRVAGPLSQFEEFARVYNCPAGSTMNPEKRCAVW
ncbi:endothelin-converting enzyme homolog [Ptychodera flava]|uniref:endothelin-converting enzyme homolog n=1 Tax=Ptychodera flava TaxID=63121 RepID=UPI00396A6F47